jgi:hypothetical protein
MKLYAYWHEDEEKPQAIIVYQKKATKHRREPWELGEHYPVEWETYLSINLGFYKFERTRTKRLV